MKTISGAGRIHHSNGFTLIELMIAVVIVGILAAIAYPNYTAYVERGKRSEGRALLLEAANLMERYYSNCNKYPRLTVAITGGSSSCANFGTIDLPTESENGYYELNLIRTLAAIGPNQQMFRLQAQPSGWTDSTCAILTLLHNGERGCTACGTNATKIAKCWGK